MTWRVLTMFMYKWSVVPFTVVFDPKYRGTMASLGLVILDDVDIQVIRSVFYCSLQSDPDYCGGMATLLPDVSHLNT